MKTRIFFISLLTFVALSVLAQKRQATDFSVKNPDKTFVGAVLEPKSINTDEHQFVNITIPDPITISFSLPIKSQTIEPTYDNMMKVIRENLTATEKIKSQQGFSYQLKEIKSYDELSLYFGQTINTETFFGIQQNRNPYKTMIALDLTQELFSVNMDLPDDGKLYKNDPEIIKRGNELLYVGSLSFGRKVTLLVSSSLAFADVKVAIEESLNSDGKPLSAKSRMILSNADMRIMAFGNPIFPVQDVNNPFAMIKDYFNRPVTKDDFGSVIRFSCAWIKDNSLFTNEY